MVESSDVSPLERVCALFSDAGVEFMVVGGQAEVLMGGARLTYDVDDLIRIKRHLGRPKDREALVQLEAIKRLREQEGLR